MRLGNVTLIARLLFRMAPLMSAQAFAAGSFIPDAMLVQWGGSDHVEEVTVGVSWNTRWAPLGERSSVYVETSLSRWMTRGAEGLNQGTLWQVGLIPVLRYRAGGSDTGWFGELGVGATVTSRLYRSSDTRFATAFNFGDHVAVGRSFCENARCELAVRFEHFSNGGIKEPNPGKNFVQLRFVRYFE
jgi:hypothetical protein